jgi:hypothetical protein
MEVSAEEGVWARNDEVMEEWRKPCHEERLLIILLLE